MKLISGNNVIYNFMHEMKPVENVSPGDTFKIQTNDCFFQQVFNENQILNTIDYERLNPATGPIYIEDAEPGDLLKVQILNINVKDKGVAAVIPDGGILGDQVSKPIIRIIDIVDGHALCQVIKIPIAPMIGVIGVAPAIEDGIWPTNSPWKHGGNMDTADIKEGTTLYFPIAKKGALLALGDCHAIMGDGEICFTGLEIPAEVTLRTEVIKGKTTKWPLLETNDFTMVIASGDTLEKAVYEASNQAVMHIKNSLQIEWEDAYIMSSLTVDLKISQVVDPKMTVRAAIPKIIVSTEEILNLSCYEIF